MTDKEKAIVFKMKKPDEMHEEIYDWEAEQRRNKKALESTET